MSLRKRVRAQSPSATAENGHAASDDGSVEVLVTKDIGPAVSGIASMALSSVNQDRLVVARENGSLVLFAVISNKSVDDFLPMAHTGGVDGTSITRVVWASKDKYILAAYFSGQIGQFDSESLLPVSLHPRASAAIWDLTWANAAAYAAGADGQIHCFHLRPSDDHLEFLRTFPKVSGSTRATCLAANETISILVAGDDQGQLVTWKLPAEGAVMSGRSEQLWQTKIPSGVPLALTTVVSPKTVVAGTSLNDVVFLDGQSGYVLKIFSSHKGPVVCLCEANGVVFASGWHELLKAFRFDRNEWRPAESKRRTHYHEASALLVSQKSGTFLSASRDGTIMHSRLSKLFAGGSAGYLDVHPKLSCSVGNVYARAVGKCLELFRFDVQASRVHPWVSYEMKGKFFIRNISFSASGRIIALSTDERIKILQLVPEEALAITSNGDIPEGPALIQSAEYEVAAVSHTTFAKTLPTSDGKSGHWVVLGAVGNSIVWLPVTARSDDSFSGVRDMKEVIYHLSVIEVPLASSGEVNDDGTSQDSIPVLVVGTASGIVLLRILETGAPDFANPLAHETLGSPVTSVEVLTQEDGKKQLPTALILATLRGVLKTQFPKGFFQSLQATVEGKGGEASSWPKLLRRSAPLVGGESSLPLSSSFVCQGEGAGNSTVLAFPRGLILSNGEKFSIARKGALEEVTHLTEEATAGSTSKKVPLLIERNVDHIVDQLPPMWRVRRFAN